MQSDGTTQHPHGESGAFASADIELLLGIGTTGTQISWDCHPEQGVLSIQGPAGAGKTALLRNLALQASAHLDVYAFITEASEEAPSFKAYVSDPSDAGELLLAIREKVRSAVQQVQEYQNAFLAQNFNRKSAMNPFGLVLPAPKWRPMSAIIFIDDFDSLYRERVNNNRYANYPDGLDAVVSELAQQGDKAGLSIAISGRSLSRSPLTGLMLRRGNSRLLLGPSTLAEREAFLITDVARLEVGEGVGLFEENSMKVAEVVRIVSEPRF